MNTSDHAPVFPKMEIDYASLPSDLENGLFRQNLQEQLTDGFRAIQALGEPLPLASYYATKIAAIVSHGAPAPFETTFAFEVYQEILLACEEARAAVLGEPPVNVS